MVNIYKTKAGGDKKKVLVDVLVKILNGNAALDGAHGIALVIVEETDDARLEFQRRIDIVDGLLWLGEIICEDLAVGRAED